MNWTTPDFEEISLNCEINCYCSAEIQAQAIP
jgi:coenzyme PQQ precursor peptide PqqA